MQSRLDAGGTIVLPRLPGDECYATRGLWVSRDDTRIVSDGACIRGLGPGEVRLRSRDGDAIAAEAVFYLSRSRPLDPTPVRVTISGLRIEVPDGVELYGISVLAHQVTVQNVEVTGAPIDAVYVGGRANEGFAARVLISDSRLRGGRRNVVSVVGGIDVRIVGNEITGGTDTYPSAPGRPWGNPAAGIDVEPGGRGAPTLGVRIAENVIADNAGPGILLALSTNEGLPVLGSQIEIVGNQIVRNGRQGDAAAARRDRLQRRPGRGRRPRARGAERDQRQPRRGAAGTRRRQPRDRGARQRPARNAGGGYAVVRCSTFALNRDASVTKTA